MFFVFACHPEAPSFGAEGSGRAARTFARFLRKCETARLARNLYDCNQGGKSGAKFGQTRVVRAVCRASGSVSHPAPLYQLSVPTTSTVSTTPYHFVPHLTRKSLIVKHKLRGRVPTPEVIRQNTSACG